MTPIPRVPDSPSGGWGKQGTLEEQWYVLVTCRDEKQQVELLGRFKEEGLTFKAVLT